jgi:hypothetical protein
MQESGETEIHDEDSSDDNETKTGNVHQLVRLDYVKPVVTSKREVTGENVKEATADTSIFAGPVNIKIKEFDYDE